MQLSPESESHFSYFGNKTKLYLFLLGVACLSCHSQAVAGVGGTHGYLLGYIVPSVLQLVLAGVEREGLHDVRASSEELPVKLANWEGHKQRCDVTHSPMRNAF